MCVYLCIYYFLLVVGEKDFVDNCHLNGTSENFWDYQEQVFDGLQESNTDNDNNTIEKRLRLVNITLYFNFKYYNFIIKIKLYLIRSIRP